MYMYYHCTRTAHQTTPGFWLHYSQKAYVHVLLVVYLITFMPYELAARRFKPIAPALPNGIKDLTTKPTQSLPITVTISDGKSLTSDLVQLVS